MDSLLPYLLVSVPSILTLRCLYCIFHLNNLQYSNPTTAVPPLKMRSFRELLSYYSQGTSLQQNITPVPYDQHIHFNLNPQQFFGYGMVGVPTEVVEFFDTCLAFLAIPQVRRIAKSNKNAQMSGVFIYDTNPNNAPETREPPQNYRTFALMTPAMLKNKWVVYAKMIVDIPKNSYTPIYPAARIPLSSSVPPPFWSWNPWCQIKSFQKKNDPFQGLP